MMQCDPSLLWTLVEQSADPGDEAESIARHLESCATCRAQLSRLGGGPTWWDDAEHWLAERNDAVEDPQDELLPLPPVDLSFLDEPSHPEMLGRIGRYDVEGLIGRGGMGVVLRAYDSDLHRTVAVKVMAPEWAASDQARQRFAREAQAAASVAHEHVIPIYNVEANAAPPFFVMRFIPGVTLERWVQANAPADVATILRVAGQLAEGLSAAHRRGLVHRDIKPGNVLVGTNIDRVWLTDFGLARAADSMTLTRTGVIAGTPHYMSPEQARGEVVDQRSDLFSLGCVLYFLSTGRPPFDAENTLAVLHKIVSENARSLASIRDDLPPSLVTLVHQLLHRQPDKRPQDCQAVIAKLSDAQSQLAEGRIAKPPLPDGLRRALVAGTCAAIVCLGVIAGALWRSAETTSASIRGFDDAKAPRTSGVDLNPWSTEYPSGGEVSPLVARATARIDSVVAMDTAQLHAQMASLDLEVRKLERQPYGITVFPIFADKSRWQRDIDQLESRIRQLENDYPILDASPGSSY